MGDRGVFGKPPALPRHEEDSHPRGTLVELSGQEGRPQHTSGPEGVRGHTGWLGLQRFLSWPTGQGQRPGGPNQGQTRVHLQA